MVGFIDLIRAGSCHNRVLLFLCCSVCIAIFCVFVYLFCSLVSVGRILVRGCRRMPGSESPFIQGCKPVYAGYWGENNAGLEICANEAKLEP